MIMLLGKGVSETGEIRHEHIELLIKTIKDKIQPIQVLATIIEEGYRHMMKIMDQKEIWTGTFRTLKVDTYSDKLFASLMSKTGYIEVKATLEGGVQYLSLKFHAMVGKKVLTDYMKGKKRETYYTMVPLFQGPSRKTEHGILTFNSDESLEYLFRYCSFSAVS
jgi:hypothetical protein